MRKTLMTAVCILLTLSLLVSLSAQAVDSILPAQANAIQRLAVNSGMSGVELNSLMTERYGKSLGELNRSEAADLIRFLQGKTVPAPPPAPEAKAAASISEIAGISSARTAAMAAEQEQQDLILASILEVGMAKRFYLVDGNIIIGTIVNVTEKNCHIDTDDGELVIPKDDILEERVHLTKKDDTRYVGPVLSESPEQITIRSRYGDITINKRDIKDMERFHGGRSLPYTEVKKTFYQGEAVLADIFLDPTAFPLRAHTFYISGFSLGYGFSDRIMIRTAFGNDFSGDLNIHPFIQLRHKQGAAWESASGIGFRIFNRHPDKTLVGKYGHFVLEDATGLTINSSQSEASLGDVVDTGARNVFADVYAVYSKRFSLESGRGKAGYHFGMRTNSLLFSQPDLKPGFSWDNDVKFPVRVWAAFDYDLSKNLKLAGNIWWDNGNKAATLGQSVEDYLDNFTLDSPNGDYRPFDFDFGFLYAVNETFRLGVHFQQPFFVIYWELYEL